MGPAGFIVAWSVLGARRSGYSALHDPISRLAAVGAPTREAMTAGFLCFGAGVGAYAVGARRALPGGVAAAAATTAAATVAVAAFPLGGAAGDDAHAVAASVAYASLAAIPFLAARSLRASDSDAAAAASCTVGVTMAAALLASALVPSYAGLCQRVGLSIGDAWVAIGAARIIARSHRHV